MGCACALYSKKSSVLTTAQARPLVARVLEDEQERKPDILSDRTLRLWDVADGREVRTLNAHTSGVRSTAFSPDGKMLASGSDDKEIKLWDVASGPELRTLSGHTLAVSGVVFSPDGKMLASGSLDGTVRLWGVR
jgi:WD40 repeat protein